MDGKDLSRNEPLVHAQIGDAILAPSLPSAKRPPTFVKKGNKKSLHSLEYSPEIGE